MTHYQMPGSDKMALHKDFKAVGKLSEENLRISEKFLFDHQFQIEIERFWRGDGWKPEGRP